MATDTDILAIAVPQLERDEGVETVAYLDNANPPNVTWGVGHKDNSVKVGTVFSMDQVNAQFRADLKVVFSGLDLNIGWWRDLDAVRATVLTGMAFNLGVHGLFGFPHMLLACRQSDWQTAHDQMLDSLWAKQLHYDPQKPLASRPGRLAVQMLTGVPQ